MLSAPTCTECGHATYTLREKTYGTLCFAVSSEALGHDWDNGTVTHAPSYGEAGEKTYQNPPVYYESFRLSQSIASSCEGIALFAQDICAVRIEGISGSIDTSS